MGDGSWVTVRAVYVHIPFCRAKCFYCDFNSRPGLEDLFGEYTRALVREIESVSIRHPPSPATTVYLGGGTPTVLPASSLARVLAAIEGRFGISDRAEITIEANPGTVDGASLAELREGGFNRLSIGVQSFDDSMLSRIGRVHTAGQAREAFRLVRDCGFDNISIDLMYALPGQAVSDWKGTLDAALDLAPEHISLYELTVEEGTHFAELKQIGRLELPDEDAAIEMYTEAIETLTSAGYEHYEISNFALPGRRSRHNQVYWRNEPYFGLGAGASGCIDGTRYTNLSDPRAYIDSIRTMGSAVESSERLTGRRAMGETVMLGLRMLDGIDLAAFEERFGTPLTEVYHSELAGLVARGLVEFTKTNLRLTSVGLLFANDVASEFVVTGDA